MVRRESGILATKGYLGDRAKDRASLKYLAGVRQELASPLRAL